MGLQWRSWPSLACLGLAMGVAALWSPGLHASTQASAGAAAALPVPAAQSGPTNVQSGPTTTASITALTPREVYLRDCATCHAGDGSGSPRGPSLRGKAPAMTDYMLTTGRMPIKDPDERVTRHKAFYPPDLIAGLVQYVTSLGPPGEPIPEIDLAKADAAQGGEVYRLLCAACHQATGSGGALIDRQAPPLRDATPLQAAEVVRTGRGSMPAFGRAAVDDEHLNDLVAYVEYLRHPEDRGGAPIWHLGPVPEGAIALGVGVVGLLLVTGWIERRRE
jgi:ubiquinol-cytochrome c reductase cytochrome c subunit